MPQMHTEFENALIDQLKAIDGIKVVRRYLGEMQSPNSAAIKDGDLPLALVDFMEDREIESGVNSTWNIYILSVAYGKAARDKSVGDLLTIREAMRKKLKKQSVAKSGMIVLESFRKLYDAASDKGYLTVYSQKLSVAFYDDDPVDIDLNLE
jgi:hypothetical protein